MSHSRKFWHKVSRYRLLFLISISSLRFYSVFIRVISLFALCQETPISPPKTKPKTKHNGKTHSGKHVGEEEYGSEAVGYSDEASGYHTEAGGYGTEAENHSASALHHHHRTMEEQRGIPGVYSIPEGYSTGEHYDTVDAGYSTGGHYETAEAGYSTSGKYGSPGGYSTGGRYDTPAEYVTGESGLDTVHEYGMSDGYGTGGYGIRRARQRGGGKSKRFSEAEEVTRHDERGRKKSD